MPTSLAPRLALALAAALALADASIVTLGLPAILIELETSVEGVALVLGVYTTVLALAIPAAVAATRRWGAGSVAVAGIALFGTASLACGLSGSLAPLLGLRAVQALGGAAVLVSSFALLRGGDPGFGRRLWVAASVFGTATGPALGGALTEAFDWRAIFLAQVPLVVPGLIAALGAARSETRRPAVAAPQQPSVPASPRTTPIPVVALALVSAGLTAVVFLVVLLLVAGWSVQPLAAALAVSVLPLAALAGSRIGGDPPTRAVTGSVLMAGGIGCLALLPGASALWTVVPQILAGLGMGMALPALAGEILPERSPRQAGRLLSIRHVGIAVALALLAPIVSSTLDDTIASAREQGAAALLDAPIGPDRKFDLAPALFAGIDTDDPRDQLRAAFARAERDLEGDDARLVAELGDRLDGIVTSAVRTAFRIAFIVTAALAALAALILVWGAAGSAAALSTRAIAIAAAASIVALGGYGTGFAASERDRVRIGDPCDGRPLPDTGGVGGFLQDRALEAIDRAACEFGSSREELLLALFDAELRERYSERHGVDPRSITDLGPALLGL